MNQPIVYEIESPSLEKFVATLEKYPTVFADFIALALRAVTIKMQGEVQKNTPVGATGNLRRLIASSVDVLSEKPVNVIGSVFTIVPYAEAVESGAPPRWIAFKKLEFWVNRKLGITGEPGVQVTKRIQKSIRKKGTSTWAEQFTGTMGYEMFERGLVASQPYLDKQLHEAADNISEFITNA